MRQPCAHDGENICWERGKYISRQQQKCQYLIALYCNSFIFADGLEHAPSKTYLKIKKRRYVFFLYVRSLRNFKQRK